MDIIVFATSIVALWAVGRQKWWGWIFSMTSYAVWAIDQATRSAWVYVVMGIFFAGMGFFNLIQWRRK